MSAENHRCSILFVGKQSTSVLIIIEVLWASMFQAWNKKDWTSIRSECVSRLLNFKGRYVCVWFVYKVFDSQAPHDTHSRISLSI